MLTVHLLRAPDYEPGDYFDVCSLLTSLDLHSLQFVVPETIIDDETYNDLNQGWGGRHFREPVSFNYQSPVGKVMYDSDRGLPLSWQELFRVCNFYRQTGAGTSDADVVMLLTNRPNALNWFSAYEGRNVFIHTADWARFIPSPPAYPIAYQILANILRLQTGLSVDDHGVWRVFHEQAIGCMNDLCQQKDQIALKLRTGDICDACLRQLKEEEVPDWLVETVLSGFEKLRKQMLFRQGFRQTRDPGPVLVNQHHQIIFPEQGNLELAIPTLHRLVYLFFLQHPEGVSRQQLPAYHPELLALYERISGLGDQQIMRQNVDRLTNRLDNSFVEKRTRINTKLVKTLGETLAKPYQITGERGGLYRIGLPRDKVVYVLP
ncbi:hypothetical protein [Spirosoma luteum]|uniref:hypothetical protein n=1 Tax=Spirosoma luteum TaxID=431553 RepID=UPI0012F940C8|nr:hypothetical protein [Spirosoma luteum]